MADIEEAAEQVAAALRDQTTEDNECPVCGALVHGTGDSGDPLTDDRHRPDCALRALVEALAGDRLAVSFSPQALREHWSHHVGGPTSLAGASDEDLVTVAEIALDSDYLWAVIDDVLSNALDASGIEASLGVRVGRGELAALCEAAQAFGYTARVEGLGGNVEGVMVRSGERTALLTGGDAAGVGFLVGDEADPDAVASGNTLEELAELLAELLGRGDA